MSSWAAEAAWYLLEKSERSRAVGARIIEVQMDSEPWCEGCLVQAFLLLWWPDGLFSDQIPACHSSPPPCPTVCVLSLRRVKAQRHLQVLVLRTEEQPWPRHSLPDPFAWKMSSSHGTHRNKNKRNFGWINESLLTRARSHCFQTQALNVSVLPTHD